MKKNIAIFGWKTGENSYGVTVPYYEYFNHFGNVHILSPLQSIDFSQYDLLVVPGGPDVAPSTYGQIPLMATGKSDPIREFFDQYRLPEAIQEGIPIVGICRGHQSIAVQFNGKLIQDMYHETNINDRTALKHGIDVFTDGLPEELAKELQHTLKNRKKKGQHNDPSKKFIEVNSMHHQVVRTPPESSRLLASHFDEKRRHDHSIEALYYPKHNIFTFQYHPEEIWDDLSITCISYLLNKVEKKHVREEGSIEINT